MVSVVVVLVSVVVVSVVVLVVVNVVLVVVSVVVPVVVNVVLVVVTVVVVLVVVPVVVVVVSCKYALPATVPMLRVPSLSVLFPTIPVKDRFLPTLPTIPVLFPIGIIASNPLFCSRCPRGRCGASCSGRCSHRGCGRARDIR